MKHLCLSLLLCLFFQSCSKDNKNSEKEKPPVSSKHKEMKEQEAPPREIVDAEAEAYSVDQVININKEIPILELITAKKWTQEDLQKLNVMKELDTLRIENCDVSNLDLSFCKEMSALKKVSLQKSKVSLTSLKSLTASSIKELDLSGCEISAADKAALSTLFKEVQLSF